MATYPHRRLRLRMPHSSFMSYAVRRLPEGANQTFLAHAPVVLASGLVVVAANPATDVFGFALRDGQNEASGAIADVLPAIDGVEVFGTLLADTAADHTIVATDLGSTARLVTHANHDQGDNSWHFSTLATTHAVKIVSFETDIILPNETEAAFTQVGDVNARVGAVVLDSVRSYQ